MEAFSKVRLCQTVLDKFTDLLESVHIACFEAARIVEYDIFVLSWESNFLPDLMEFCASSVLRDSKLLMHQDMYGDV